LIKKAFGYRNKDRFKKKTNNTLPLWRFGPLSGNGLMKNDPPFPVEPYRRYRSRFIREGTLAVQLAGDLRAGEDDNEAQAEDLLDKAGIAPKKWLDRRLSGDS